MKDNVYNERVLLNEITGGNMQSFEILYRRYYDKYYAIALTYLYTPELAEDALQELFLRVWNKRDKLEAVEDFSAYLFVMFRNMIISELRKKKKQLAIIELTDVNQALTGVEPHIFDNELPEKIDHLISTLPPKYQAIYKLSREDGLNHKEISSLLRLSPRTVSNTISLILGHLRKSLSDQGYLVKSCILFSPFFL